MPKQLARPEDIFADVAEEVDNLIDPEDVVHIDVESINNESQIDAADLIANISKLYFDEEFIKSQPNFKKRVDAELESLRINLKMRKADEVTHDILLKNLANNPNNASMYKALTELQKTIISITNKIDETIIRLTNTLKAYQMELNFDEPHDGGNPEQSDSSSANGSIYKGSKAFIEAMDKIDDDDIDIPEDDDDEDLF